MNWTEQYFDEDYFTLYENNLTEDRTRRETSFLLESVFNENTKRILDMPCGYGRHSASLAAEGCTVHGIDASDVMLAEAQRFKETLPEEVQTRLTYEKGDMREYSGEGAFDAALSLFSSLGYFDTASENEQVVANLCASVQKGGIVVIDVRNPIYDLLDFSRTNWERVDERNGVAIVQTLDPKSMVHTLTYHYKINGKPREKTGIFRHYTLPELQDMLARHGCEVEETFGNFKGDPYSSETKRMIVVAKRR